jgi:hypothetical protein
MSRVRPPHRKRLVSGLVLSITLFKSFSTPLDLLAHNELLVYLEIVHIVQVWMANGVGRRRRRRGTHSGVRDID